MGDSEFSCASVFKKLTCENEFNLHENDSPFVLKERHKGTRKWPITLASMRFSTYTDFVIDVVVSVFVAVAKRCS